MELLASDAAVTACKGRLVRYFPGPSVGVKASVVIDDHQFRVTLVDAIVKLDQKPASSAGPGKESSSLRMTKLDKIPDTTHPRLVTEMIMSVILAYGQPADTPIIRKNTREEVLLSHGHFPWRRSPLWLLIRVALQLTFERLANKFGAKYSLYKQAMVYIMTHLLNMATEHGSVPHDMLYSMSAKISRRMLKLSPDPREAWVAYIEESMKKTSSIIQQEWEHTQKLEAEPLDFSELSELEFERDTALDLRSLEPYLAQISSTTPLAQNQKGPDNRGHPFQRNDGRYLPRQNFTRDKDFLFLELADFEHSVAEFLGSYMVDEDQPVEVGTSQFTPRECPDQQDDCSRLIYEPILEDQVRLLKFKEPFSSDVVELEMKPFRISPELEFRVLSYFCSDEIPSQSIIVNQHSVQITEVLYAALLGSRDLNSESPTWLWVDTICTDSSNMGEKSKLVTMRKDIYESSIEVLVPLASALSPLAEHAGLVFELAVNLAVNADDRLRTLRAELDKNYLDAATFFKVLVQVADDRWFSNPWAPQEVAFCKTSPLIMSGANSVPLAKLCDLCAFLAASKSYGFISDSLEKNPAALAAINTILFLGSSRQRRRDMHLTNYEIHVNPADSFLEALESTINYPRISEPHDTIYSFVGFMGPTDLPEELQPDYSLPFAQVCHRYAQYLIQGTGKMLLSYGTGNHLRGVPTWVPDFRHLHCPAEPAAVRVSRNSFSSDGKVMKAKGKVLTEVAGVFPRKRSETQARAQRRGSESDMTRVGLNLEAIIVGSLLGDWRHVFSREGGRDFVDRMDDHGIAYQLHHRRDQHVDYFATDSGHLGSCEDPEVGDVVAVLVGAERPVLLRQCESYYRLVGTCVLSGDLGMEEMEESFDEGRFSSCDSTYIYFEII
jgi:hypothetical protein